MLALAIIWKPAITIAIPAQTPIILTSFCLLSEGFARGRNGAIEGAVPFPIVLTAGAGDFLACCARGESLLSCVEDLVWDSTSASDSLFISAGGCSSETTSSSPFCVVSKVSPSWLMGSFALLSSAPCSSILRPHPLQNGMLSSSSAPQRGQRFGDVASSLLSCIICSFRVLTSLWSPSDSQIC